MSKVISILLDTFENDNRVARMATSLADQHDVTIVGLHRGNLKEREELGKVMVHRVRMRLNILPSGKFFTFFKLTEFSIKAILKYRKADIWHCNDFEAFALGCMAKLTRPRLKLVYDCHEYETERYYIKGVVKKLVIFWERRLIRFAAAIITVSPGIMAEYRRLYGDLNIHLVRNTPHLKPIEHSNVLRETFGIKSDQIIFLYQGMINPGRGIEILLDAFQKMSDDRCVLVVMGRGKLEALVRSAAAESPRIFFHPAVPYHEINRYSGSADVGLNTPQNHCLSYYYCLPNKLFEYIQAGIPILTNNLPDCRTIVESENIGEVIEEFTVDGVIAAVQKIRSSDLELYRSNLLGARERYHWQLEQERLFSAYESIQS